MDDLEKRKEKIKSFFQNLSGGKLKGFSVSYLPYLLVLAIAYFGFYIRTRNLWLLEGKYIPDVDSYAFLRYAEYVAEHGKLMALDTLRYYPFGFNPQEFRVIAHVIANLYHVLHFFNPSATVVDGAIFYPPLALFIATIFFFLFVRKIFDSNLIAVISSLFLVIIPPFVYRTTAGVADKEPLAMMFMFMSLYFFSLAWKLKRHKYLAALGAGVSLGLLGAVWGGASFLFLTYGLFMLVMVLLGAAQEKNVFAYGIMVASTFLVMHLVFPLRFPFLNFLADITSLFMIFGLAYGLASVFMTRDIFSLGSKFRKWVPDSLSSLGLSLIVLLLIASLLFGPDFLLNVVHKFYLQMTQSFSETRWALTVAENKRPYFTDILGQFSARFVYIAFIGALLMFYQGIKHMKKKVIWTALYALMLCGIALSRYAAEGTYNGETPASQLMYIISLIGFFVFMIYGVYALHRKNPEAVKELSHVHFGMALALAWFLFLLMGARSAIRLFFVVSPAAAMLAGYFFGAVFDYAKTLKKDLFKVVAILLLLLVGIPMVNGFARSSIDSATGTGLSYHRQWQNAMSWVRENTPEDAVFAHWWDYGYWVQWGGRRATLSDGGNAQGSGINFFTGRHVLTAQNETEALEFLKSRNTTHLLMIKEEVGKYSAYSSIGSDENYDRYSWVPTVNLDKGQSRTAGDLTEIVFSGGFGFDESFTTQNITFNPGDGGVLGFVVSLKNGNGTVDVLQPKIALVKQGQQYSMPLECVYYTDKMYLFKENDPVKACLRIVPSVEDQNQVNPVGNALYLSPRVYRTLFAKLFLLNQESPYFKLAYTDENQGAPLAMYRGYLIGPLKIWEIHYPDNLTVPEEYYTNSIPDRKYEKV